MRLKIRQKILLYIMTVSVLLYVVAIGYILMESRKVIIGDAYNYARVSSSESARKIEKFFEKDLALVRTLANAYSIYKTMPTEQWQKLFVQMYNPVLKPNTHIYSLWDSWEMYGFVPGYNKEYGRIAHTLWREGGEIKFNSETRSMNGDPQLYGFFKKNAVEAIWDPYFDVFVSGKAERKLMTTLGAPVLVNSKYMGMVGVDVELTILQEEVLSIKPFEGSFAFLLSNSGLIAGHPNKDLIYKNISEVYKKDYDRENIGKRILKGEEFSFFHTDSTGKEYYLCFAPVKIENINTPWSLVLVTPMDVINAKANRTLYVSLIVGTIGLLIIIFVLIFVSDNLTKPIKRITSSLKRLAGDEISNDLVLDINTGDEIEEMAKALNTSVESLNEKAFFATEIGKGSFNTEFTLHNDKDILGKSLIEMRDSLKTAHEEEEKRRVDDQKRTWANEGFAKFAEILRQNNNDFQVLCDNVIKNLVRYLEANQGGIFLLNEEDKKDVFFELISAYAWDRKKHISNRLELGEGLVGACAMEKETIFMTEVPDDYITITSGLGNANPRCIILVPLKHEEVVLGVIEMASFKVLEKYQIEFLERIAESIASTILSVKINAKTKFLLEQSQQQAEEMAAQEEEMRQNMEELQATQEEAARKSGEIEGLLNSLNSATYMVEYDLNGNITHANDAFIRRLGFTREQLIGTHHSGSIQMTEKQKKEYGQFWDSLRSGFSKKTKTTFNWAGKSVTFLETYIPIQDGDGKVTKIIKMSHELEDFKD